MVVRSEEVAQDADGIPVRCTLTRPEGTGPHPGIVFVAGSGPTDRDWCTPLIPGTLCSGLLLADGDADPARLYALASNEGAIHALNYQLRTPEGRRFAGLVLTGAPGRSIGAVARSQILAQMQGLPNGELLMRQYDAAIAAFEAGEPMHVDPVLPEGMRMLLGALPTPVNLPFAREIWTTNPAALLARVDEPALVVIGKKDIQADWEVDGGPLSAYATAGEMPVTVSADADAGIAISARTIHARRTGGRVDLMACHGSSGPLAEGRSRGPAGRRELFGSDLGSETSLFKRIDTTLPGNDARARSRCAGGGCPSSPGRTGRPAPVFREMLKKTGCPAPALKDC